MLKDVTIKNYRCFEDFTIDGLSQVNLIVGSNQVGKTSLLEAIYLLVKNKSEFPESLFYILDQRREFIVRFVEDEKQLNGDYEVYELTNIFNKNDENDKKNTTINSGKHKHFNIQYFDEKLICNDLDLREFEFEFEFEEAIGIGREIVIERGSGRVTKRSIYLPKIVEGIRLKRNQIFARVNKIKLLNQNLEKYIFISSNRIDFEVMATIWENITLTSKEDKVVEALQIIDPKVERIGFYISEFQKMIRVKLKGETNPLPLSSMGDGMSRILSLAMAAVTAENGVLLVDEIDTGLHYQVQTDMWRLIIQTARELNIQVFATTHSWDCICALQEVLAELEDKSIVKLFRLSKKYGKLGAVEYDSEDIDIAVRQSIEVR